MESEVLIMPMEIKVILLFGVLVLCAELYKRLFHD
jgi:hypothetical protein